MPASHEGHDDFVDDCVLSDDASPNFSPQLCRRRDQTLAML
jgi:hypothetical protein